MYILKQLFSPSEVRLRANAIFEEGSEALFRLEHSRSRVVPRSLTELRSEPAWSFESSIFKALKST